MLTLDDLVERSRRRLLDEAEAGQREGRREGERERGGGVGRGKERGSEKERKRERQRKREVAGQDHITTIAIIEPGRPQHA